jgi:hypothetical protein
MKVKELQSLKNIEKNPRPVTPETMTGKGSDVSQSEYKTVSPFCEFCHAVPESDKHLVNVFPDKYGFLWRCGLPLSCPHAITMGSVIADCMILKNILKAIPGNPHDIDPRFRTKRKKLRAQLSQELKMIRGIRSPAVV